MNFHKTDWKLLIPILLLVILGVTILNSAAPDLVPRQLFFIVISAIIFLLLSHLDFKVLTSIKYHLYLLSILFLFLPLVFGSVSRGAVRWIQIGEFSLQPSEIIKPLLLVFFAQLMNSEDKLKYIKNILFASVPFALILFQPDLGTTLVLAAGWFTIFMSKISFKNILALIALVIISVIPVYQFLLLPYQKQRILTFVNPYTDPLGSGYHVIQSVIAVGSGGLSGKGLGQGSQSQLRFLPEHHTDFIFASLSEELGFLGAVMILVIFLSLLHRIYTISQITNSSSEAAFCLATVVMIAFQVFINIGMNMGIAPITGITLPFISSGGSSLLSLGINLGLIHSVSKASRENSEIFRI